MVHQKEFAGGMKETMQTLKLRIFLLAFGAILLPLNIFAQPGGLAGISGVVKDPAGASIPNAKVVISSDARGIDRVIQTNDGGVFNAPALQPGAGYKVAVSAAGFAPYEAK